MNKFDEHYWSNRYKKDETNWDMGEISPPLKAYFDQLPDKDVAILIPGAGNSWEAEYLHRQGFTDVTVIDLSDEPLNNLKKRVPSFPSDHLIKGDFFDLSKNFDIIIEQTFFCALDPRLRKKYVSKMHSLLKEDGKLVGVLFDDKLNDDHPPFGGSKSEYEELFSDQFGFHTFDLCYNSVPARSGRELFINFIPK